MSLRRRVVWAGVVIAAVLFVADVALAGTFRSFLLGRLDQQLIEAADRVADSPPRPSRDGGDRSRGEPPRRADNPAFSEYFIARADGSGNLVERLGDPLWSRAEAVPNWIPGWWQPAPRGTRDRCSRSSRRRRMANGGEWSRFAASTRTRRSCSSAVRCSA